MNMPRQQHGFVGSFLLYDGTEDDMVKTLGDIRYLMENLEIEGHGGTVVRFEIDEIEDE